MLADRFFGVPIAPETLGGQAMALLMAVLLGGLIGLEREWHGHPAGLRTHILVCVGATLITLTSVAFGRGVVNGTPDNPGRIAANVVVGIGFLGAGAIIRDGLTVHGLTTAASIWTTAGIGLTLGAGPRLGELATIATVIVLATLVVVNRLEDVLKLKRRNRTLELVVAEENEGVACAMAALAEQEIVVLSVHRANVSEDIAKEAGRAAGTLRRLRIQVQLPGVFDRVHFYARMSKEPEIISFLLD